MKFAGYKFEVVDIDNYRIDQLLVTRIDSKATALSPKLPDAKDKEESVLNHKHQRLLNQEPSYYCIALWLSHLCLQTHNLTVNFGHH